jgi:hypothetical protein
MNSLPGTRIVLALGMLLLSSNTALAEDGEQSLVETTPHFAFYSDFATNLNDALIAAGSARNDDAPELFHNGSEEESCFLDLPSSVRTGWDLAVDYYAKVISPNSWLGRQQYLLRADLAGFDQEFDAGARRFIEIAQGIRMAATPAYEACRWSLQDAENRRWIDELIPQLSAHESAIAGRLEQLYQTPWHDLPIRVDIVYAALPVGANTIDTPPHSLISSSIEDSDQLEIVLHEASHTLMRRNDPMQQALAEAARELDMELPRDLWHVVLFYTTGETVRRILEEDGELAYSPYMYRYNMWNGRWGEYRDAIEKTWPAYLDGQRTLPQAASDLLQALAETKGNSH